LLEEEGYTGVTIGGGYNISGNSVILENQCAACAMAGMTPPPPPPAVRSGDDVSFDFSNTVKQANPGSGSEYKTLIYIELAGGLDGAAVFVNVKNEDEVLIWCSSTYIHAYVYAYVYTHTHTHTHTHARALARARACARTHR